MEAFVSGWIDIGLMTFRALGEDSYHSPEKLTDIFVFRQIELIAGNKGIKVSDSFIVL